VVKQLSRDFQIFVKPAGASCNLRCSYCYYLGKKDLFPDSPTLRMNVEILEKYICQHIEASEDDIIMFSWHGGEPLLAGMDFYQKAVQLQKKYKPSGRKILNGIQTNATLLTEEWCRFFATEDFIAGISIDGPGELHNKFRRTTRNEPTLQNVLYGYELLQKYGVTTEILCVLNSENVKYPLIIYNFFRQLGTKYITFLPLVTRDPGSPTGVSTESVGANDFGSFLSDIFNEWIAKDIGKIKIQIFEEALRPAFNQEHTMCIFRENCGGVPVVEHNGDFYSCDHYVDREHYLGNIADRPVGYYLDSERQRAFGMAKSLTLPRYCIECTVKEMCNGECPKNRFIKSPDGEPGLNYLCSGYKMFFENCQPFLETLRNIWLDQKNV